MIDDYEYNYNTNELQASTASDLDISALLEAIQTRATELEESGEELETTPFLEKSFNDYTVIEGLLACILLALCLGFVFNRLKEIFT